MGIGEKSVAINSNNRKEKHPMSTFSFDDWTKDDSDKCHKLTAQVPVDSQRYCTAA
jgi:hypothetical protein